MTSRLHIGLISSALPPLFDGIGDYTARLAEALTPDVEVSVYTTGGFAPDPIAGVEIVQPFNIRPRRAVAGLVEAIVADPPDWLILQYNPFSFGRWGVNPSLPRTILGIRRVCRNLRFALMIHEIAMPADSLRNAGMSAFHHWQFRQLSGAADITFFSTGPWCDAYQERYPSRMAHHLPVGSNIPYVPTNRSEVRASLGISNSIFVLGAFGGDHPSRLPGHVSAAARRVMALGAEVCVLSIGSGGTQLQAALHRIPTIDLGRIPASEVSRNLHAVDVFCAPFDDGVSTRRGSFFAALQHRLAVVATHGRNTDAALGSLNGKAFVLTPSSNESAFAERVGMLYIHPCQRNSLQEAAEKVFAESFSWPALVTRQLLAIRAAENQNAPEQTIGHPQPAAL